MKNGVIGEQNLTTNIKLNELAAKIISRNDPSNASKQKTLSLGMKKRKRDAKRLKNLIGNVTEHVKALEKQANKTELSNPDELKNDDNKINFNFENENILDQILEKPADNTEPNNPDDNSFDELRWIELELENEDNQIDFNEVKGSDMIKEDANIENLATQNDNNDKKIIMIKIDEIKEYEEKQNYLDNKQNNFDDMKNLNLIIRDKIIQNKDEQKDFDEMNKLSMSKNDKNDEMQLSCKEGDKMFSSNLRPNGHWQPVHEGVRYPCNLCNYKAKQ